MECFGTPPDRLISQKEARKLTATLGIVKIYAYPQKNWHLVPTSSSIGLLVLPASTILAPKPYSKAVKRSNLHICLSPWEI